MDFKINQAGMNQLQRQLEEQFFAGIQVPLGGIAEEAVQSLKDQLVGMGATPNDEAVEQIVRDARNC